MALHLKETGGVSAAYILPKLYAPAEPTELAGGRIWIVLRGVRGDALFAHIYIEIVEQFEDGINAGDFLLTTNFAKSYRCSISYDSGIVNFPIRETTSFSSGIREVEENFFEALSTQVGRAVAIKLQKPSAIGLSKINVAHFQRDIVIKPEKVMEAATENLSLEEIWAGVKPTLPPFANFVYHAILSAYGEVIANSLIDNLSHLDPTVIRTATSANMDAVGMRGVRYTKPVVDIRLFPVEPDRIYARKFIARCKNTIELADIVEKSEHAEKRHQDMLRDIVTRLKSLGFFPLQSSSIDLVVRTTDSFTLFELKTTISRNIMAQAAKGIFQLGCYQIALMDEWHNPGKLVLIMEATGANELESYVFDVLSTFGICSLFYDIDKPWPNRLQGLDRLLV